MKNKVNNMWQKMEKVLALLGFTEPHYIIMDCKCEMSEKTIAKLCSLLYRRPTK